MSRPHIIDSGLALATLGLAAGLLAAPGAGLAEETWTEFVGEGFRAMLPSKVEKTSSTTETPVGSVVNHEYIAWLDDHLSKYEVDVSNLPHAALMFLGPDAVYSNAKGGLLKRALGKPVSFEKIDRDGREGRELVYRTAPHGETPGELGKAQMFLVGKRLLVFEARVPADHERDAIERFFSSISLAAEDASATGSSHSW